MFKNEVDWSSNQSQLFTKNNEYHDYNTRHSSSLHLPVERGEDLLAFMELTFGII